MKKSFDLNRFVNKDKYASGYRLALTGIYRDKDIFCACDAHRLLTNAPDDYDFKAAQRKKSIKVIKGDEILKEDYPDFMDIIHKGNQDTFKIKIQITEKLKVFLKAVNLYKDYISPYTRPNNPRLNLYHKDGNYYFEFYDFENTTLNFNPNHIDSFEGYSAIGLNQKYLLDFFEFCEYSKIDEVEFIYYKRQTPQIQCRLKTELGNLLYIQMPLRG
jgi:hypothetical protein